jgi:hypothetical protein
VLLVITLFRRSLAQKAGIARFSEKALVSTIAVAVAISFAGVWLDKHTWTGDSRLLRAFLSLERTMDSVVLVALAILVMFVVWYPIRLPRNIALIVGGIIPFFALRWASLLLVNWFPLLREPIWTGVLVVSPLVMMVWLLNLRKEGEHQSTVTGIWKPEDARRLNQELEWINTSLERLSGT